MATEKTTNYEIVPFKVNEITTLEVMQMNEDVWLTAEQIAKLFGVQRSAITKHINNIYNDEEMDKKSTCSILEHMGANGQIYQTKQYNLDMIVALGYRVKCKIAIRFRQWATQVIKNKLKEKYEYANHNELAKTEQLQIEDRAKRVKYLLQKQGRTLKQTAKELGFSNVHLSYCLHGKSFNIIIENWINNFLETEDENINNSNLTKKLHKALNKALKGDFKAYKTLTNKLNAIAVLYDFNKENWVEIT